MQNRKLIIIPLLSFCLFFLPANVKGLKSEETLSSLSPDLKKKIDQIAKDQQFKNINEKKFDFKGNVIFWIISQASITPEEEKNEATILHNKIKKDGKIIDSPEGLKQLFKKLVTNIPTYQKYWPETDYQIYLLDQDDFKIFTNGGGFVYITKPVLNLVLQKDIQQSPVLAFFIAHELGHISLGNTKKGFQLEEIQTELKRQVGLNIENDTLALILKTAINPILTSAKFLYSREQSFQADLFAIHLCRNCSFNLNYSLDALRILILMKNPEIKSPKVIADKELGLGAKVNQFFSFDTDPVTRLKRLLNEIDGKCDIDPYKFGLFKFDPDAKDNDKTFFPCGNNTVEGLNTSLVFLHGLRGNENAFKDFFEIALLSKELKGKDIFVFRYPNNQSLYRSGEFFSNEIKRVFKNSEKAVFICHSAGGLVFRYFSEIKKGEFNKAYFLGTPNAGSEMIKLKFLLDINEFVLIGGKSGIPTAIRESFPEGSGEISSDLQSGSLFLSFLKSESVDFKKQGDYTVFKSFYFSSFVSKAAIIGLETVFLPQVKAELLKRIEKISSPLIKKWANQIVDKLLIPDEIKKGDLAVTLDSAKIALAKEQTINGVHHIGLLSDKKVVDLVIKELSKLP